MLGFDKFASLSAWARLGRPATEPEPEPEVSTVPRRGGGERGVQVRRRDPEVLPLRSLNDLGDLRHALAGADVLRFRNDRVRGLTDDSRLVKDGWVFFAVPGHEGDGAAFAAQAVGRGAVAVVAARALPVPVPCFVVPDVRRAASRVADVFHGAPSRRLPVIGVTGTNGKTTVADLLRLCLEDDARPVGSLGTIEYRLGPEAQRAGAPSHETRDVVLRARNTTPGPIEIQSYLREMVDRGVRAAVLEVSSHALDQGRTDSVVFAAAVFTNLTQDHLDYHGSMESYAACKARLFGALRRGGIAVLPADDPTSEAMREKLGDGVEVATYALGSTSAGSFPDRGAHVRGEIVHADLDGTRIRVRTPDGCVDVHLPLVGTHNVRNALAAMACAIAMGIGSLRVADALRRARPVRGRLERVETGRRGFRVFVDYAHTPDALKQVLQSLKPLTSGTLRVLFGCGGDRDASKRPIMGEIAARVADHVVITHDNPRGEDPERILSQILEGVRRVERGRAVVDVCPDRRLAIEHVLSRAAPGDTIVLAGKGHELGQSVAGRVLPFDDREEAEVWLCSH